jgi:hypothetical protein
MAHLLDRDMAIRAERAVLLTVVGGGFAICAVGALVYDLSLWIGLR